ncbi:hypothetical protein [Paenibacillus sp. WLX2291]|uniref:hypothetical protein n=1 Tax=Paenibacillus sp. WLX2291 TaxID=3296934 RepID=UPI003983E4F6
MNPTRKPHYRWASLMLAGAISIGMALPASAASDIRLLNNPSWTSPSLFTDKMDDALAVRAVDVHAIPSKSLVYVHTQQDIANTTGNTQNNWYLDTIKGYSLTTGKPLWSYSLHESAGPYTLSTQIVYAPYGTAYIYAAYSDGTYKLLSLHSSGKLNWEKTLPASGSVTMMKDGSLLVTSNGNVNSEGIIRSSLSRFDTNGKLLNSQTVQGSILHAEGDRILVAASKLTKNQNGWQMVSNPQMDVYGLELKRLYKYQFPAKSNIYGDGSDSMFVLKNGTVLVRANIDQTGNKLFAFDPSGKVLWGRVIPGDSITQSTGTGYITYENKTLKLYNTTSGKAIASATLEGDPANYTSLDRTTDGNLMINMADRTYVLYPTNLSIVQTFDTNNLGTPYDYVDQTVYTVNDDMLNRYKLK